MFAHNSRIRSIIKTSWTEHTQIVFASNLGGSKGLGGMACLFIDLSSYEFALQLMTHSVCGGETGKEIPLTVPPSAHLYEYRQCL